MALFPTKLARASSRHEQPDRAVYFDANASERVRPEAKAAFLAALDSDANPASVHAAGRGARRQLEQAREDVAAAFGADPRNVVFTSGGTEGNALALHGIGSDRPILIGATEHDSIRQAGPARVLPVRRDGTLDLDALDAALDTASHRGRPPLVCVMAANNETGVLHPLDRIAAIVAAHGALLHVDAVQLAGRREINLAHGGIHSLAVSSHKLGGLPGAGALLLADGVTLERALIPGGGQELGRRGGTPSVAAQTAFAAVAGLKPPAHLGALRDRIDASAIEAGAVVCGAGAPRLPNTTCLALPGRPAAEQLIILDLAGFAVSAGAACSSGKVARSHVLDAMGLGERAAEAIRVSLSWSSTAAEVDAFIEAYRLLASRRTS